MGKWVGILTFLSLAHMVDAMQRMQLGGVGMLTFLASAHMTDATQVMGLVSIYVSYMGNCIDLLT